MRFADAGNWTLFTSMIALAGMLAACGVAPEEHEQTQDPEADVGQASQALGNFQDVYTAPPSFGLLHLSTNFNVFSNATGGCTDHVLFANRTDGTHTRVDFDECRRPVSTGAGNRFFVGDAEKGDILFWNGASWVKIADTTGDPRGNILVNSTHAFWTDDAGLRRAPRGGGSTVTLVAGANLRLGVIDGTNVYYMLPVAAGDELWRIQTNGTSNSFLVTTGTIEDPSFDSTKLYWASNSTGTKAIRSMNKSTLVVGKENEGSGRFIAPHSTGTWLYWAEEVSAGHFLIQRKTIATGSLLTEDYFVSIPMLSGSFRMKVFGDGMFLTDYRPNFTFGTAYGVLVRGDR